MSYSTKIYHVVSHWKVYCIVNYFISHIYIYHIISYPIRQYHMLRYQNIVHHVLSDCIILNNTKLYPTRFNDNTSYYLHYMVHDTCTSVSYIVYPMSHGILNIEWYIDCLTPCWIVLKLLYIELYCIIDHIDIIATYWCIILHYTVIPHSPVSIVLVL